MVHDGVLGVDVGGTHIRAAAITLEGKVIARRQTACRAVEGFEAVVARLAATVAEAAAAGGLPPDAPVGVALPGPVNPHTGVFAYPYTASGQSGDTIYKRLQVHISDLDPAQNGGGQYFVEGQYVTQDDATAGHQNNNASYRPITVTGSGTNWTIALTGTTQREKAGIRAEVKSASARLRDSGGASPRGSARPLPANRT